MKVVARVKLEKSDISQIHEVIVRDIVNARRSDFVEMREKMEVLVKLLEKHLNNAFSRGMEFRDRNVATHIDVE